jgi:hypothetical protein
MYPGEATASGVRAASRPSSVAALATGWTGESTRPVTLRKCAGLNTNGEVVRRITSR